MLETINQPASPESRAFPRLKVPAMYSLVRVRPAGARRYDWIGHIYDVSLGGMRFELDESLEPGAHIEVRGILPGADHIAFRASGRVVRIHSEEQEPGPIRMGMTFESFQSEVDLARLRNYLDHDHPQAMAA